MIWLTYIKKVPRENRHHGALHKENMTQQLLLAAFFFAFFATKVSSLDYGEVGPNDDKDYSIDQFLNQSKPIWVFNTTQPNPLLCKNDVNKYMTSASTFFTRSHKTGQKYTEKNLEGRFGHHDESKNTVYDMITVYEADKPDALGEEVLEFLSDDKKCAVVSVMDYTEAESPVWRELRLEDSIVANGQSNTDSHIYEKCFEKFDFLVRLTRKKSTKSYSEDCKTTQNAS
uniref:Lipocalin n=1 Tax=Rhipicephalus appendiculatus TaxID=34631 RepID=A0A131YHH0_RHIAP